MNYELTKYLGVFRYFAFMQNKRLFMLLVALCTISILTDKLWLQQKLEEVSSQKSSIMARKFEEMDKLNVQETIEILKSFALINTDGLWIHTIKIEQNTINVTIRAFDAKMIEKYIYEVAERAHLKLVNMVTKNVNYKEVLDDKTEEKSKQVPFAVKLYLDSIKKNGSDDKQSENEGDDNDYIKKNKIFFAYEAQITLLAHAN
jgi:hypothetical protein